MTERACRYWIPGRDKCHDSPFHSGLSQALLDIFPVRMNAAIPDRIARALDALNARAPSAATSAPDRDR